MEAAGVAPETYPTLKEAKELWDKETPEQRAIHKEQEKDRRSPRRQVYCEVGYSKCWSVPLHVKLKELRNKHGLKWLRLSMSYHRFPNLREQLGSDLRMKMEEDAISQIEVDRPCSCAQDHKIRRGKCIYGGRCLTKCSVYEATVCNVRRCTLANCSLSSRSGSRFIVIQFRGIAMKSQVRRASGMSLGPFRLSGHTTLSSHMQRHMLLCLDVTQVQVTAGHVCRQLRVDIGWMWDPIKVHRTFGTIHCQLCNMERWQILELRSHKHCKLMNADIGLYRGCDCIKIKRFHILKKQDQ